MLVLRVTAFATVDELMVLPTCEWPLIATPWFVSEALCHLARFGDMSPVLVKVAECKKGWESTTMHDPSCIWCSSAISGPRAHPPLVDELMVLPTCEWPLIATPWFVSEALCHLARFGDMSPVLVKVAECKKGWESTTMHIYIYTIFIDAHNLHIYTYIT